MGLWWYTSRKRGTIKPWQGFEKCVTCNLANPWAVGCCEQALGAVVVSISSVKKFSRWMGLFDQPQLVAFMRRLKSEPHPGISTCRSPGLKKKKKPQRKNILFIFAYFYKYINICIFILYIDMLLRSLCR